MDKSYIQDHSIVDKYVQNRLPDSVRAEFEMAMIEQPELAEQVDLALLLHNAMKDNKAELSAGIQQANRADEPWWQRPGFAAAASILAVSAVALNAVFLSQNASLKNQVDAGSGPQKIAARFWLESGRGTQASALTIPGDGGVLLQLDAGPKSYASYTATSTDAKGHEVWSLDALQADGNRVVSVYLPTPRPGEYTISLSASNQRGDYTPVADYTVKFQR